MQSKKTKRIIVNQLKNWNSPEIEKKVIYYTHVFTSVGV